MADISAALQAAVASALRGDAGVVQAFAPAPVAIFDIVPVNTPEPYLTVGVTAVEPVHAEGFDLSTTPFEVHVWSRPALPGLGQAQALSAAARAVLPAVRVDAGGRVYAAVLGRTQYLIDPSDERTVHAIVACTFTTAPA